MLDFICEGLLEMWGTKVERELHNDKFLQLESVLSAYEANTLIIALRDLISIKQFKIDRVLPEFVI